MKVLGVLVLTGVLSSAVCGQDLPTPPSKMRLENKGAASAPAKPKVTEEGKAEKRLEPAVTYGGVLADFHKAPRRLKMFSLRTPLREVSGAENLSLYPGTEHVQGVVLFRVKF